MWTWNGGTGQKGTAMNLARQMLGLLLCSLVVSGGSAAALEKVVYFHNDAVGSPVAATNAQGQVLWTEAYDPYGTRVVKPASAKANQLWYTGKQEETELGLNYFGARWYEPGIGRFHGIDPVDFVEGNVQSFNRYTYANNNPYTFTDPDGLSPKDPSERGELNPYNLADAGFGPGLGAGGRLDLGRYSNESFLQQIQELRQTFWESRLAAKQGTGSAGKGTGPAVDRATGREVGRIVVDSKGNAMIEPVGGKTVPAGKRGEDTHTLYPNGSNYQRLNPNGHANNPVPHAHGHLEGTGANMTGQGASIDVNGNVVPPNSAAAHWPIK